MRKYILGTNSDQPSKFSGVMSELNKIRMYKKGKAMNQEICKTLRTKIVNPYFTDKESVHRENLHKLLTVCKVTEQVKAGVCVNYRVGSGLFSPADIPLKSKQTVLIPV